MPLALSSREQPELFSSMHYMARPVQEDRLEIVVSGVAAVGLRGTSGGDWHRQEVDLRIDLAPAIDLLTADKQLRRGHVWGFAADQWVALVTLNSISNAGTSLNAGWAVDGFCVEQEDGGAREVHLLADLAVSDVDGVIHRVAYQVTLLGGVTETKAT